MATKIIMYTGDNCSKCKAAKVHLGNLPPHIKEEVTIIEINVDETKYQRDYVVNELKSNTLPTFELFKTEDYNEKPEVLRGFDENIGKIMEHLGL
ncbi:thioredoxin domain-containing protein (plasmid) [Bacillus cereus]|uniref:glutaredoxin family protein n=1 Tax=Bacillus cereus TaxID=1396 RepID=UPI001FF4EABD|nr:thioredoxin domain-containing protein [Bacillus cereus]UOX99349.1 thioredoxin domain-containing protein [Bacillus cereus]